MVLVIFVIMLLNVDHAEPHRRRRLKFLLPLAIGLAAVLIAETAFFLYLMRASANDFPSNESSVGLTRSIGQGLFTGYLLPFEVTSILLLMAIVGAMSLARRTNILSPDARVVPGSQVLARDIVNPRALGDLRAVKTDSTDEAAQILGVEFQSDPEKRD